MPNIPIFSAYPVAWTNPVTMRASAALPAAGAWDAAPTEQNVAGAGSIMLSFTYTRGAAGGAFDFQIQSSIYSIAANVPAGAGEWATESLNAPGAVFINQDADSDVQREYTTYGATAAGAETFTFGPVLLSHTIERLRIRARESGQVGSPGTLALVMECYS